ncbi:TetR family transcriptional regulator [Nocardia sp. alder85J]
MRRSTAASNPPSPISRALGVTSQTVYRYFPGTEALLTATRSASRT